MIEMPFDDELPSSNYQTELWDNPPKVVSIPSSSFYCHLYDVSDMMTKTSFDVEPTLPYLD